MPESAGDRRALAAVLAGLVAIPLVTFLVHSPGTIVRDTRLVHFWSPSLLLERHGWLWTDDVGLGGVTAISTPLSSLFVAGWRAVGLEPWVAQRLWLAAVVAVAATGAALLVRELLRCAWWGSLVSGLWMISAPYTMNFLIPSWLFVNVAISPWLMLALVKGTTSTHRWRWAAVFALALALAGTGNVPGLVYSALPLIPLVVYLRFGRRVGFGRMASWCGCAALLVVPMFAHAIFRAAKAADALRINLALSEQIDGIIQTTSWSESVRGLGLWLVYWPQSAPGRPYSVTVLTVAIVVLASFAIPAVAILAIQVARRRERLLLGTLMVGSVVMLVGGYTGDDGTPYGWIFTWLNRNFEPVFAFRSYYKVGGGLLVAVSLAIGLAATWIGQRPWAAWSRAVLGAALVVCIIVSGWPMWTGELFESDSRFDDGIPQHWHDAAEYLNAQPDDLRVTAVPAIRGPRYRWGNVADGDMLSVLVDRPVLEYDPFLPDPADSNNLVLAVGEYLSSGSYAPGSLRPLAERIGLGYIVIRNDLAWERSGLVRPIALEALREDPDIELVAAFAPDEPSMIVLDDEPDEDDPADGSDDIEEAVDSEKERRELEAGLPAVEIYKVRGVTSTARVVADGSDLIVSGDGEAWPLLARGGLLDEFGPVAYSARLSTDDLVDAFRSSDGLALTDSNRRAFEAIGRRASVLTAETEGGVGDRFEVAGSQTVVSYGDASALVEFARSGLFSREQNRPAAMFDGDPDTAWLTGRFREVGTQAVRVDLREEEVISDVEIHSVVGINRRQVSAVRIEFAESDPVVMRLRNGYGRVRFTPRTADRFIIRPIEVMGEQSASFGLSEVVVAGLDLAERLVLPDDVSRRAETNADLRDELTTIPLTIAVSRRDAPLGPLEAVIHRRFRIPSGRSFDLSGLIQPVTALADIDLGALVSESTCRDDLLLVDDQPVGVRLALSTDDGKGSAVQFRGCSSLHLDDGWHEIRATSILPVNDVVLRSRDGRSVDTPGVTFVEIDGSDRNRIDVTIPVDGRFVAGQASADGWTASVDGADLGPPATADTQAAWSAATGESIEVRYAPDRIYRVLLVLALAGVLLCVALIIWNPRGSPPGEADEWTRRHGRWWLLVVGLVAVAWFAFGVAGGLLVAIAIAAERAGYVGRRTLVYLAAAGVVGAAVVSIPPLGPELTPVTPAWPHQRDLANTLARLAMVFFTASLAVDALRPGGGDPAEMTDGDENAGMGGGNDTATMSGGGDPAKMTDGDNNAEMSGGESDAMSGDDAIR